VAGAGDVDAVLQEVHALKMRFRQLGA
jgi:hypothetical protein